MKSNMRWLLLLVLVVALGGGAYYWWQHDQAEPTAKPPASAPPAAAAPAPSKSAAAPSIENPINAVTPQPKELAALPALAESDAAVAEGLTDLLGRKAMLTFLSVEEFIRRFTATLDNLDSDRATARLWPVQPTPGRFMVIERQDGVFIAEENAERYKPFVQFVQSIDTNKAVALYVKWYPLFQQAYKELGYPNRYFNDRVIEVIDDLLETPEPKGPLAVTLTQVNGPIASTKPWVRYEYADDALEALSAGEKILLRMGNVHRQTLKAKLLELRDRLAKAPIKSGA